MTVMCSDKVMLDGPQAQSASAGSSMPRPKTMDMRKIIPMPADLVERIADFRHGERISSESEAIRLLIVEGLKSKGYPLKDSVA